MKAFLRDDLETAQKLSGEVALGMVTGIIKARKERVKLLYLIIFI
jgi:hypothetical protein